MAKNKPKKTKSNRKARRGTKKGGTGGGEGKSGKVKHKSRGRKPTTGPKAAGKGSSKGKKSPKETKRSKGAGKGSGSKKEDKATATKRKAEPPVDEPEAKKGKILSAKQKRKKEVTKLYSELINPGRTLKADVIVKDILEALSKRSSTMAEYCSTNLGARVIEACLKWGTKEQRQDLLSRCSGELPKMAQDRYGHQVVLKLLLYASKTSSQRKPTEEEKKVQARNMREILDKFSGKNLHATFFHRYGCRVINGLYFSTTVKAGDKRRLLHSIAIPEAVALRRPELPSSQPLRKVLQAEDLTEQQKKSIAQHLEEAVEKLGKVLAELNANQAHPSRDWKNDRNDRETFPDFSDCVEPVDEELPEWATAVVDRSSEGFFKDGMWQSADGKDEHSRGKVTWKKNHERRGHHARYQKRRQERENEAKACGQGKPNAPVAAGMVKGPECFYGPHPSSSP